MFWMSGKRYTEDFKIETVHQAMDRGYKIGEVSDRLGVTRKSLCDGTRKYDDTGSQHQMISDQLDKPLRLKSELRRG